MPGDCKTFTKVKLNVLLVNIVRRKILRVFPIIDVPALLQPASINDKCSGADSSPLTPALMITPSHAKTKTARDGGPDGKSARELNGDFGMTPLGRDCDNMHFVPLHGLGTYVNKQALSKHILEAIYD